MIKLKRSIACVKYHLLHVLKMWSMFYQCPVHVQSFFIYSLRLPLNMQRFFLVGRLEEKEAELKREYSRLHDRYTELFKTHVDYMERTKMLVGSTERLESVSVSRAPSRLPSLGLAHMSRSSGPLSYGFQSLEASINVEDVQEDIIPNVANLRTEMLDSSSEAAIETSDKSQITDQPVQENKTTAISRRMLRLIVNLVNFFLQCEILS